MQKLCQGKFSLESLIFCLWLCRYRYMPSISMFLHQESLGYKSPKNYSIQCLEYQYHCTVLGCIPADEMKFVLQHLPGKIAYKVREERSPLPIIQYVTFLSSYFSSAGVNATGCCQNFNFVAESTFNAGVSRLIIAVGICLLQRTTL